MKTTLDLPDTLVREVQDPADQTGQELTQTVAELLWKGLAMSAAAPQSSLRATIKTHAITGLPYIECGHTASPAAEMTPERVADVLLEQEATWQHEAGR